MLVGRVSERAAIGDVLAHIDTFVLNLRIRAPRPVRDWLGGPLTTRGLVDRPGSTMSGGSLVRWYDLVVHRQEVSPVKTNGR